MSRDKQLEKVKKDQQIQHLLNEVQNNDIFNRDNTLTPLEFANMFNVSIGTIHRWRRKHNIPFIKIGRSTFFLKSNIQKWMISMENNK